MAYQKQTWRDYDDNKTEVVNMNQGAVVTPERLNHMETGIANSADKAEVTAQLQQTEQSINAQLAQKTDKGNVSVSDINKNLGKLDQTYMSDEFIGQFVENTQPINATPENGSVTSVKIAKNAVSPEKVSFLKKPNNTIHFNDAIEGYTFDHATGLPVENSQFTLTDFIPVLPNTYYTSFNVNTMYLFDESLNYTTRRSTSPYLTEGNTAFARFVVYKTNTHTAQVNEGTNLKPYDISEYKLGGDDNRVIVSPTQKSIEKGSFQKRVVTPEDSIFFEPSNNLFNKHNITKGKTIDSNGNIINDASNIIGTYTSVEADTTYSKTLTSTLVVAEYSKTKKFIRRLSYGQTVPNFTTTSSTGYVIFGMHNNNVESMMVNEGEVLLPYEDYYFVLKGNSEYPINIHSSLLGDNTEVPETPTIPTSDYEFDKYDINPAFMELYSAPTLADASLDSSNPLIQKTTLDIYALYDNLMAENPDYITKELLGNDVNGVPIYKYEFIPDIPRQQATHNPAPTKRLKMIITTGVHGVERQAVWTNYNMFYQMCNNWKSDTLIEAMRWDVHFVVIPVANPWAFDNNKRKNANGVDINRNFQPNWVLSDFEAETYGGTEPLSELESQYIYSVLDDNRDAVFYIDFHNFFSSPYGTQKNFLYTYSQTKYGLTKSKGLISRVSRKWRKEHDFLSDSNELYGYAAIMQGASASSQGFSMGLNGMTFEQSRFFELEPGHKDFNSISNTLGLEAYVNFLASLIRDSNIVKP